MSRLQGKIALITGGTTGIGAATAMRFKAEGAQVIVTGSNPKTLDAARSALPGIEVVASDAADLDATKRLVDMVAAKHGRIDVLFVNAGMVNFSPIANVDAAFFDRHFNLNVRGAYFVMQHAAAVMSDGGSIIITASIAAHQGGHGGLSVYGATKAAIRSFGRSFAAELAPRRIRVNTISPGPIETPIFGKSGLDPDQIAGFVAQVPLGRFGKADEIAEAALYFASDDSAFTTGAELVIDGGMLGI